MSRTCRKVNLPHNRHLDAAADACDIAKRLKVRPEERPSPKYYLEAIVIGGIVAAGYLNAALYLFG